MTLRRRMNDESGVVMIVVMGTLLVLSILAAAVLATAVFSAGSSTRERGNKGAYGAAMTGLRTAIYRLNASPPASDDVCQIIGNVTSSVPSSGLCGPYSSDAGLATTQQPMPSGQRFDYWITPVLASGGTCAGAPLSSTLLRRLTFAARCITARGQYTRGGTTYTRRVQARVVSARSLFPIPGIWGTACVAINANLNLVPNTGGCDNNVTSVSGSTYTGSLGSNATAGGINPNTGALSNTTKPIQIGLADWQQNPATVGSNVNPANLYLGNTTPASGATVNSDPYSIKDGNGAANPNTPTPTCPTSGVSSGGSGSFTVTYPCLPWPSNPPVSFGFYFPLLAVGDLFSNPPLYKDASKKPTAELACAVTDVRLCNNDLVLLPTPGVVSNTAQPANTSTLQAHYSGGSGCTGSPYNPLTGALAVGSGCTLTMPDGTYYFCSISLASNSQVLPADQTAGAEVRVFLDNTNAQRSGSLCSGSSAGSFTTSGQTSNAPTWFTRATPNSCSTSGGFAADPWTAIAGQLYIVGAGDPPENSAYNNVRYPPRLNHFVALPAGMLFAGLIQAPNSTMELGGGACVRGGLAAAAVNVANNGNFTWDASVDSVAQATSTIFTQTAFSDCPSTYATDPNSC